jgi:hypothetical protein
MWLNARNVILPIQNSSANLAARHVKLYTSAMIAKNLLIILNVISLHGQTGRQTV